MLNGALGEGCSPCEVFWLITSEIESSSSGNFVIFLILNIELGQTKYFQNLHLVTDDHIW